MFSYVALVWNDEDPEARAQALALPRRSAASGWQTVLQGRGLEVRCAGLRPGSCEVYRFAGGEGVVLGKLFVRGARGSRAAAADPGGPGRALYLDGGRRLTRDCWGRYVAFLNDPGTRCIRVLRDPSAGLPCYTLRLGAVEVFFSRIEDVLPLCERPFTIDWSYLAAGLALIREHSARTGLREVTQVIGGECVEIRARSVTRRYFWDPICIADSDVIEDPREAATALGECVADVVRAWAGCFRNVLLSLSGGLDSTIILACLAGAPGPRIDCYHYYPLEADLDERSFARAAAEAAGVALIERPRQAGVRLEPLLSMHPAPEPTNYPYYLEHSREEAALAAECGAQAVFIGYGGDQLFYQERAQWAAGDFLCRRGLRPGWLRVLLDSARMDEMSMWRMLALALRARVSRRRWSIVQEAGRCRPLLSDAALAEARRAVECLHPLLRRARGTPSGKLWHAHQIVAPFDFYDPLAVAGDPERVAPLLSQPLMELCLRIPTYVLTAGGWDRAIARRAFYQVLPAAIRNRRHKGGMEAHLRLTVERNRRFLIELLREGCLVRQGLLDPVKLARALCGAADIETESGELLEYAGVEAWLRQWVNRVSSPAVPLWQTKP